MVQIIISRRRAGREIIMGWKSFGVVGFDLGPLLQGQMGIAKLKSSYNSLIIDPRGLHCETNLYEILG